VIISLLKPANYRWEEFRNERLAFDKLTTTDTGKQEIVQSESTYSEDKKKLKRWGAIASIWAAATFLGHWVLW
jgi:urea-proton symporter